MKLKKLMSMLIIILFGVIVSFLYTKNASAYSISTIMNEFKDIEKLLPEGAEIVYTDEESKVPLIIKKDIDKNNVEDIFVAYRDKNINNVIFLSVIKRVNEKLSVLSTVKGEGYNVDILDFTDIDGDGREDVIYGLRIGSTFGKVYAFSFINNSLDKIFSTTYSKIEIIPQNKYGNKSKQAALAIWRKDTGEAYKINIVRWSGKEFIEAKDVNRQYFKKVVEFYEDKVKTMPKAAFYWYYLADAQNKAGLKKEALKSISIGVSLDTEYPSKQQFEELKKSIK